MASLNKVLLAGNLTRDPDLRYTQGGTAICGLGLAVNRRFVSRGEEQEEVCFVDIDVFGRQAETCKSYLRKGAPALVEGRLRLDQWEDRQSGEKRSKLKVVAERVQFLGGPSGSSFDGDRDRDDQGSSQSDPSQGRDDRPPAGGQAPASGAGAGEGEGIPF